MDEILFVLMFMPQFILQILQVKTGGSSYAAPGSKYRHYSHNSVSKITLLENYYNYTLVLQGNYISLRQHIQIIVYNSLTLWSKWASLGY